MRGGLPFVFVWQAAQPAGLNPFVELLPEPSWSSSIPLCYCAYWIIQPILVLDLSE